MSTRYKVEVVKRARIMAADATDIHQLDRRTEHPPGECVECDALRLLNSIMMLPERTTLHRIRRILSGQGADPDPSIS